MNQRNPTVRKKKHKKRDVVDTLNNNGNEDVHLQVNTCLGFHDEVDLHEIVRKIKETKKVYPRLTYTICVYRNPYNKEKVNQWLEANKETIDELGENFLTEEQWRNKNKEIISQAEKNLKEKPNPEETEKFEALVKQGVGRFIDTYNIPENAGNTYLIQEVIDCIALMQLISADKGKKTTILYYEHKLLDAIGYAIGPLAPKLGYNRESFVHAQSFNTSKLSQNQNTPVKPIQVDATNKGRIETPPNTNRSASPERMDNDEGSHSPPMNNRNGSSSKRTSPPSPKKELLSRHKADGYVGTINDPLLTLKMPSEENTGAEIHFQFCGYLLDHGYAIETVVKYMATYDKMHFNAKNNNNKDNDKKNKHTLNQNLNPPLAEEKKANKLNPAVQNNDKGKTESQTQTHTYVVDNILTSPILIPGSADRADRSFANTSYSIFSGRKQPSSYPDQRDSALLQNPDKPKPGFTRRNSSP